MVGDLYRLNIRFGGSCGDQGIGSAINAVSFGGTCGTARCTVFCSSTFDALNASSYMHVNAAITQTSLTQGGSSFVYSFGLSQPRPAAFEPPVLHEPGCGTVQQTNGKPGTSLLPAQSSVKVVGWRQRGAATVFAVQCQTLEVPDPCAGLCIPNCRDEHQPRPGLGSWQAAAGAGSPPSKQCSTACPSGGGGGGRKAAAPAAASQPAAAAAAAAA